MKFNDLTVTTHKKTKRVGRGIAAGQGKTAGRGTKGQKSRAGHNKMPAGFMGGQKAFMQAVPKLKGFKSLHKKAEVVYLDRLGALTGVVDNFTLFENSMISTPYTKVKILSRGEIKTPVTLKTQFASKTAIEALKKVGGTFEKTPVPARKPLEKAKK
ncbi:MAG: 50S ribosomal protein L15 [Candidatus Nomurabacteria bacterium]|jgi:large subunit ribosomal protein L15|nr:50S ribosomal protein L15 [Candidatus Nomurabacteria bacterium]